MPPHAHPHAERDLLPNRALSALGFEASHFDKLEKVTERRDGGMKGDGVGRDGVGGDRGVGGRDKGDRSVDRLSKMFVQLEKVQNLHTAHAQ